jgi:hypothetical protein
MGKLDSRVQRIEVWILAAIAVLMGVAYLMSYLLGS